MEKRSIIYSLLFAVLVVFASCAKQNNPPSKVEDPNPESERIYGDIDGPPRQTANTYEADPAAVQKADMLRQKLYGDK